MTFVEVDVLLPAELAQAARALADDAQTTVGQVMRDALKQELARRAKLAAQADNVARAASAGRGSQRVAVKAMAPAATVTRDAHQSREADLETVRKVLREEGSWGKIRQHLKAHGFELRYIGKGVALFRTNGQRVMSLKELGVPYGMVMRRLGAPMPGAVAVKPRPAKVCESQGGKGLEQKNAAILAAQRNMEKPATL